MGFYSKEHNISAILGCLPWEVYSRLLVRGKLAGEGLEEKKEKAGVRLRRVGTYDGHFMHGT